MRIRSCTDRGAIACARTAPMRRDREMMTAPKGPAQQHWYDAAQSTKLVESASAGDWAQPSPVAEWTARDIVQHLVEWSRGFLTGAGIDLPALEVEANRSPPGDSTSPTSKLSSTTPPGACSATRTPA